MLDIAVAGKTIGGPHGNFWRGKTRDDFVSTKVLGKPILISGDGANSLIVKALAGEVPFGRDVPPPNPGEAFRRMPAGLPAVSAESLAVLRDWIDAGCPDVVAKIANFEKLSINRSSLTAEQVNDFFRDFDNFFGVAPSGDVQADEGNLMGIMVSTWPGFGGTLANWQAAISSAPVRAQTGHISAAQLVIFRRHFGDPTDLDQVTQALVRFGRGDLPDDPLRPGDPHQMNGSSMWVIWLGCCAAAIASGVDADAWTQLSPRIACGMVHDAFFRNDRPPGDRLIVTRFDPASTQLPQDVIAAFDGVTQQALVELLADLSQEAMGITPTPVA